MTAGPISRRGVVAAPILLAGCGKRPEYFGNTRPAALAPDSKIRVGPERDGLDPATYNGGFELYILPSLLEGLISYDPYTLEPSAALATHYEVNGNETRLTFFLRGHRSPRGIRLPLKAFGRLRRRRLR